MTDEQLSVLITGAIPVVLAAFGAAISWFNLQKTRAEREQAQLEREGAEQAATAAHGAAADAHTAKAEVVALGAALGAGTDSGAPHVDT